MMHTEDQIKHLVEKYTTVSMNDKEFLSALNPTVSKKQYIAGLKAVTISLYVSIIVPAESFSNRQLVETEYR